LTDNLVTLAILSVAIGSAAWLFCKTEITSKPRLWIASRSGNKFFMWLSKLLNCPYCLGMWLSIAAVLIYRPRAVHLWLPLDLFVSVMTLSGLSMLTVLIIKKALGK